MSKTWLITGCSSGFGREIALEALRRGDNVVATARNVDSIRTLRAGKQYLALPLDITQNDEIEVAVTRTIETFGRIDVLVNNAGFGSVGAMEETSDRELRAQFDAIFEKLDMVENCTHKQSMRPPDSPLQRSAKRGNLFAQSPFGKISEITGSPSHR